MKVEIINLRNEKPRFEYDFYIDRRMKIGNPFAMRKEEDRRKVIKKYERWFLKELKKTKPYFLGNLNKIEKALKKHGKVRLFCWCHPLPCHGDVIKKHITRAKK